MELFALFFGLLVFLLAVALSRWIFRINAIVARLDTVIGLLTPTPAATPPVSTTPTAPVEQSAAYKLGKKLGGLPKYFVLCAALALFLSASAPDAWARGGVRCSSCPRDSHGSIQRSEKAVKEFKRANPKPSGCNQCQVDHVVPLSKGGADDPSNMQWLPKEQHQDKTKRDLHP